MLEHHQNEKLRFDQQVENSRNYVLPFIETKKKINAQSKVLEVGCGEGGVMQAFLEKGAHCLGVDLDNQRLIWGADFLKKYCENGQLQFLFKNIYDQDFVDQYKGYFDLIILKDVIEHIPEQEKFIPHLVTLLKPEGKIFFGFPPWYMPYGGHQQLLTKKITSRLPYYHILPMPIYLGILKLFKEPQGWIDFMKETKETGISIERFERIIRKNNLKFEHKTWYLINPIYKYKFGLKARKQNWLFGAVPHLRNYLTTCVYYLIGK